MTAWQLHRVHYGRETWGFSKTHPIIIDIATSNLEIQKDPNYTFLPLFIRRDLNKPLHFPITVGQLHRVHYRDQQRGFRLLKNPSNHHKHWNKQFGNTKGVWLHLPSSRVLRKPKTEILTINLSCRTNPLKHDQDEYYSVINFF